MEELMLAAKGLAVVDDLLLIAAIKACVEEMGIRQR